MWQKIKRFFGRLFGRKYVPVPAPEPEKPPLPVEPPPAPTPPEATPHPKFRIDNLDKMSEWYRARFDRAVQILNRILSDPSTRARWLTYRLAENQGKTNSEIWDMWVKGDQLSDEHEDELTVTDIKAIMYRSTFGNGVVGYTYLDSLYIWVNSRYFSTDKFVTSNLGHEGLGHQYGFTHTIRDYQSTVPWRINQLIEEQYDALGLEKEFPPL